MEFSKLQELQSLASSANLLLANGAQNAVTQRYVDAAIVCLCDTIKDMLTVKVVMPGSETVLHGHDPYSGRDPAHVGKQYDAKTDTYR